MKRPYTAEDVNLLKGSLHIEHTIASRGAKKLTSLLSDESHIISLGAMTGCQAVQQAQAGLKAIYVSGWQVAADNNQSLNTYPDQSLYPSDSVPWLVSRINKALQRADQIEWQETNGHPKNDYWLPIVADAEAGFGGNLNTFELAKALIEAGVAAIHLEDQLASAKKCGHLGGKVLVPTSEFIQKLVAIRLASDIMGVPTLIMARTDAQSASFITSNFDPLDEAFIINERTAEGFYKLRSGLPLAINRALAYADYADLIWCETSEPDLQQAKEFAAAIHQRHPGKWLAYNLSPSFNWQKKLNEADLKNFQLELAKLGYKYQFITLAGFHSLNVSMFDLAKTYQEDGMLGYSRLQGREFELEKLYGYRAVKHQSFVGTGYFDKVAQTIFSNCSTAALKGSTEEKDFKELSV